MEPKLLVFASGSKEGGGSGFKELVENSRTGILQAEIVVVVSNHEAGGVRKLADSLGIPFEYFPGPFISEEYQKIVAKYQVPWVALSGWLKLVLGLNPQKTINIHPAPLPIFGGKGMYGHFVHEAVIEAYKRGEIICSAVSMHFVTEKYDEGPVFFQYPVLVRSDDTLESLRERVNKIEHSYQSWITSLVVTEQIKWDGKDRQTLEVPSWYPFLKPLPSKI